MADSRTQYPQRSDISQQGKAKPAAAPLRRQAAEGVVKAVVPAMLDAAQRTVGVPAMIGADAAARLVKNAFSGSTATNKAFTPPAKPAVTQALEQGRAAEPVISPYDRQLALLDTVFKGPLTMREAAAYSGMLPKQPGVLKPKEAEMGRMSDISQALFASDVKAAEEKAKTDVEGGKAMTAKAMEAYLQRGNALVGVNPLQYAIAQQLGDQEEAD